MDYTLNVESFFKERDYIENIFSSMREGVIIVNRDLKAFYMNEAAKTMGFKVNAVIGKSIFEIFPDLSRENSKILKVFQTKKPIKESIQTFVTYRGERKTTVTSTYPILKGGEVVGAFEIFSDISGLRDMSEKLQEISKKDLVGKSKGVIKKQEKEPLEGKVIIGESSSIKKVKEIIKTMANSPSPLLIYGETGTGKELIVQEIQANQNGPLVTQNCAAIPESLLESILFGTKKGGFTGAEDKPGLFQVANNGTLFLDEINSMPVTLQTKILRVLQEGKIRRVGDHKEISVNVRLISAMNVRPEELVNSGEMRQDLYYRLNVLYLEIPPLRERKEDIPYLVEHFISYFNKRLGKNIMTITPETMEYFLNHDWPGNVRELKNMIERAVNLTSKDIIALKDVQPHSILSMPKQSHQSSANSQGRILLKKEVARFEAKLIKEALRKTDGNISRAARELDIPQQTLDKKIKKYGLKEFIVSLKTTLK
ncbi:sigma-54 interaction domain-containing protein [Pseudalkalibacillus caeni]|uniref:PAS domain-containing protein n=1 Tax=Exobacillus caeni TaxID=2574798 RepID=A0A5R9F6M8_9BACL|nr:sigma 54-interacting transcriptional regulator [Pseudalkalibacillus caeni]TLS36483.1 PAS domain-containing protein [Pseudalkalibacillus caeni]